MKESIFQNKVFQILIRLMTALSFVLFTAYQSYLAAISPSNRLGRLLGIGVFLIITLASFFDFSEKGSLWIAHSVLLVIGLILLFSIRMLNLSQLLEYLDPEYPPSVLNFAIFVLSQLGVVVLVVGHLMVRAEIPERRLRILLFVLMSVAIVLYIACFVLECVQMIKYRVNIDFSLKITLLTRVLYCAGFVGTAVSLILPAPKKVEKDRTGQFLYSERNEDEIDLVI